MSSLSRDDRRRISGLNRVVADFYMAQWVEWQREIAARRDRRDAAEEVAELEKLFALPSSPDPEDAA